MIPTTGTGTGAGTTITKSGNKTMPAGVEKTLHATLRCAFGMPVAGEEARNGSAVMENIDNFFLAPTSDSLPKGFSKISKPVFKGTPVALGGAFMTKRKKPIVAYFVEDDEDDSKNMLLLALRGDRKNTESTYAKVDNELVGPLTSSIWTTLPRSACNFHPWFSSVIFSAVDAWNITSFFTQAINTTNNIVSKVSKAIAKNNIVLAMCVPMSPASETILHNLAHEKPTADVTKEDAERHEAAWMEMVNEHSTRLKIDAQQFTRSGFYNITPERLKNMAVAINASNKYSSDRNEITELVETMEKPGEKPAEKPAEKPEDNPAEKPTENPVKKPVKKPAKKFVENKKKSILDSDDDDDDDSSNLSNKKKRDQRYERSGQAKFISEAIEASSKADEREGRATRKFEKRLKKMDESNEESNDDESDNDSEGGKKKNKKTRKNISDSGDESEMSRDSDEDSDDEDSDDDDSEDEEDSDDDEDSGDEDVASSDDEKKRPKKKSRLVKTTDLEVSGQPTMKQTVPKLNRTVLAANALDSNVHDLDAVTSADQRGVDDNNTRLLAVNTLSAVSNIAAALQVLQASKDEFDKSIKTAAAASQAFQADIRDIYKTISAVAKDYKKTAAKIEEDE